MGVRGAVPNRTENLSRERDANRGNRIPIAKGTMRDVIVPSADENWHPVARMLWDAAFSSGMADFYQNSDWAYLFSLVDDLSTMKIARDNGGRVNGQILATLYSAFSSLGFTEGDRRRMRIELETPKDESKDAAAAATEEYRESLRVVK